MAKTVVGLYDDRRTAHRALDALEDAGFGEEHLRFATHEKGERHRYEVDADEHTTPAALERYGIAERERKFYSEGVRRGGAIVIARVHDQDVDRAVDIMARHNPIRYEDRAEVYEKEGYTEAAYDETKMREERERFAGEAQERLKEIEEHLKIGKREVVRGGVRVHKYVETDVEEETLRLREEHVDVDRRDVNRPASPAEVDAAFEEKTVEMVERGEEAVVEKEAVVTGEVAVGKDVDVREETVGGEVRKTRVEVEQLDAGTYAEYEPAFKEHYQKSYAGDGEAFDYYKPAYRYGYAAGTTYGDRNYADVERDLRTDYERRHGDESAWDKVKDAVRHGYERART